MLIVSFPGDEWWSSTDRGCGDLIVGFFGLKKIDEFLSNSCWSIVSCKMPWNNPRAYATKCTTAETIHQIDIKNFCLLVIFKLQLRQT